MASELDNNRKAFSDATIFGAIAPVVIVVVVAAFINAVVDVVLELVLVVDVELVVVEVVEVVVDVVDVVEVGAVVVDVVVAGGTLGVMLALALQRRGRRVCIVEKRALEGRTQE